MPRRKSNWRRLASIAAGALLVIWMMGGFGISAAEVQKSFEASLPPGTTGPQVESYLNQRGLLYYWSAPEHRYVTSIQNADRTMVWPVKRAVNVHIYMDNAGRLTRLEAYDRTISF